MKDNLIWTQENIRYQGTDLYEKITRLVKGYISTYQSRYRSGSMVKYPIPLTDIKDAIKKHTELSIDVRVQPTGYRYDAFATSSLYYIKEVNHFLDVEFSSDKEFTKKFDSLTGMVDIKKGKVSGFFADSQSVIVLSPNLFFDGELSPDEVAAIILHEVGHVFTSCFYINHIVRGAYLTSFAAKEIMGAKTPEQRKVALITLDKIIGDERLSELLKYDEIEDSDSNVSQVIIDYGIREVKSETDTVHYDHRVVEQVADHFAAMHGAGYALVTGIIKLNKLEGRDVSQNFTKYYLGQLVIATGAILGTVGVLAIGSTALGTAVVGVGAIGTALAVFSDETYDGLIRRVEVLRRDTIEALKDRSISREEKLDLAKKIESIEAYQSQLKQYPSLFKIAVSVLSSRKRKLSKEVSTQSMIEELINNDLFVKSAKF